MRGYYLHNSLLLLSRELLREDTGFCFILLGLFLTVLSTIFSIQWITVNAVELTTESLLAFLEIGFFSDSFSILKVHLHLSLL